MVSAEFTIEGNKVKVGLEFEYSYYSYEGADGKVAWHPVDTRALLYDLTEGKEQVVGVGDACLHADDQFEYRVGRRVAFIRAYDDMLKNMLGYDDVLVPREFKTEFFEAFGQKVRMF